MSFSSGMLEAEMVFDVVVVVVVTALDIVAEEDIGAIEDSDC
jgi:hypothetical protein